MLTVHNGRVKTQNTSTSTRSGTPLVNGTGQKAVTANTNINFVGLGDTTVSKVGSEVRISSTSTHLR